MISIMLMLKYISSIINITDLRLCLNERTIFSYFIIMIDINWLSILIKNSVSIFILFSYLVSIFMRSRKTINSLLITINEIAI